MQPPPSLPLTLLALLLQSTSATAWNHFDRSPPTRRTIWSFRWSKPFLDLDASPDTTTNKNNINRDIPGGFHVSCQETRSFPARQYTVADLHKPYPEGLLPWERMLDIVLNQRIYPGGWEGDELSGDDKTVVLMEYKDVPLSVRMFVEQEAMDRYTAKRWLFGVYDKPKKKTVGQKGPDTGTGTATGAGAGAGTSVAGTGADTTTAASAAGSGEKEGTSVEYGTTTYVEKPPVPIEQKVMVFAPGALYDILPLWVADESRCKKYFRDLDKYVPQAAHDSVIAWVWPMPRMESERDVNAKSKNITFEIKATRVLETAQGRRYREAWEAIHLQASRAERRLQKMEREMGKGRYRLHGHDEL